MDVLALWGKTLRAGEVGDPTHALVHHMLDVGAVAEALWDASLPSATRKQMAGFLGQDLEQARGTVTLLAALHDLGKACPAFQMRHREALSELAAAGLSLPRQRSAIQCYHGVVTAATLPTHLSSAFSLDERAADDVARTLGGHHGSWPTGQQLEAVSSWQLGGTDWDAAREDLVAAICEAIRPPVAFGWPSDASAGNAAATLLAGLTSAADWIGSMNEYFPYVSRSADLSGYLAHARDCARQALGDLHWGRLPLPDGSTSFGDLFPEFPANSVQQAVIDLAPRLNGPSMVIIEAPTGTGKTEAALYLAEQWAAAQGQPGLYLAMPTMATSNQMHGRLAKMMDKRHPGAAGGPLLVHGQALWQKRPPRVSESDEHVARDAVDAMAWFLPRKRSLLAPFGVGTVDQAFFSVLQTRHFFVRMFGLAHKTVVFDEVHAYDAYMTVLFERLLGWLHAMGTSVILLSATLSSDARARMLAAYGGTTDAAGGETSLPSYPAIHWRSGGGGGTVPVSAEERDPVALERTPRDESAVVDLLRQRLSEGGCAAVICNTVRRAQSLYLALRDASVVPERDLILFHARYPYAWRKEIEDRVLQRYGKARSRGARERSIVVATQVIEQSLDLDFDYMVTDMAPIDLLIQRAGRLHRHPREKCERPAPLWDARLAVALTRESDGVPEWGDDGRIYAPYVLLRTLLALDGRDALSLPKETPALIAAVYDPWDKVPEELPGPWRRALDEAYGKMMREERSAISEAALRLVPRPTAPDYLDTRNEMLHDEDPQVHASLQALTRLSEPSVTLVCLHETARGILADPGSGDPIDLSRPPDDATTRALVSASVSVGQRGLYQALVALPVPSAWERHPLLRFCRLATFVEGIYAVPGSPWVLSVDRKLGLQARKERL